MALRAFGETRSVPLPLLAPTLPAFRAFSDIGEMFQSDECLRVLLDELFGDGVIGLHFQPSLSLLNALQASFCSTSAFFLQAFA